VSRGEKSQILSAPSSARVGEVLKLKIQSKDMFGNNVQTGGDPWAATSTGTDAPSLSLSTFSYPLFSPYASCCLLPCHWLGPASASIQITDQLDGTYVAEVRAPPSLFTLYWPASSPRLFSFS